MTNLFLLLGRTAAVRSKRLCLFGSHTLLQCLFCESLRPESEYSTEYSTELPNAFWNIEYSDSDSFVAVAVAVVVGIVLTPLLYRKSQPQSYFYKLSVSAKSRI